MLRRIAGLSGRVLAVSAAGTTAYLYADEGRWQSTRACTLYSLIMTKTEVARAMGENEDDIHRRLAPEALELTKELGGYYLKAAQTMVGANILPDGRNERGDEGPGQTEGDDEPKG